jgi:hypothetical protein
MGLLRSAPPHNSRKKLADALKTLGHIKANHTSWMNFSPSTRGRDSILHPHPVFSIQLNRLLSGSSLSATLKKTGWIYFLRDRRAGLVCAEVSIVSGRHKNARLTEGPFVKKVLRSIEKVIGDSRIRRHRHQLRFLRVESVHLFCLWLRVDRQVEHFIPVTSSSTALREGEWISRRQFTKALELEGQRIRDAQERMSRLLERHRG